ncbi:MAG: hypothetical protein ACRCSG_06725 [Cellulosilyticaceae bacterium]
MKLRVIAIALGLMLAFTGCTSKEETTPETNGQTQEQQTEEIEGEAFTGTIKRETLASTSKGDVLVTEVTFEDGKPVDLAIDIITEDGQSKNEIAANGEYVMVEGGTPWNEQVAALVEHIKENNFDLSTITYTNEEGNTDVVTGVSIKVVSFVDAIDALIQEVANGEVSQGFTGVKIGEVQGEKDTVIAKVMYEFGQPVNVKFDVLADGETSKYEMAKNGEYVMVEGGMPWNEQVDALAAFIVENNFDLSKVTTINDEGNTDVVSGVSIKVNDLLEAVAAAIN